MKWFKECTLIRYEVNDVVLGHHFAVDADAFTKVRQVGRGVEADAVTRRLKHGSDGMGAGALTVGSGDVYGTELSVWMPKVSVKRLRGFQSGFVCSAANLLEQGRTFVKVGQRLFVGHHSKYERNLRNMVSLILELGRRLSLSFIFSKAFFRRGLGFRGCRR